MVDAWDLKSHVLYGRVGSSPTPGTRTAKNHQDAKKKDAKTQKKNRQDAKKNQKRKNKGFIKMRRFSFFLILCLILTGVVSKISKGGEMRIEGKKVLMVIAHQDFRDEEYKHPREILENAGAKITVASSKTDTAYGSYGLTAQVDILLNDVEVEDYDCVIFVGGMGSSEYFNNEKAHSVAREMLAQNKLVCAICIAPNTLAQAGILKDKKVTAFPSVKDDLAKQGAIYTGKDVEIDGNIITANGPQAAKKFGETILRLLGATQH